ncbi:hypothetical protein [Streptococcus sp. DD12]|uniref:hypothetical protein n=1 Tax=Streptococcus sp. DD12 TaxID=1777880 RepID=UPI0007957A4E|nr:hypothetical protein [Streptococcus sp. DD12]KXT77030.1 hypothetical protein STRDD12_00164 [Streptococcus sp. DD12]
MLLDFEIGETTYAFASDIETATHLSELELAEVVSQLDESSALLAQLTPDCDKTDYILAACSGVLCGVMAIFLVGEPGDSPIGELTDHWFEKRTMGFAKLCGWDNQKNDSASSAIRFLEKKFKIPYDQRGAGDAASWVFDLNPKNHHFKSLGHNPTLLGLFFSILDQFSNSSHFVSGGELISLVEADNTFQLRGLDLPSKLFSGFINWLGHLMSDISGSSGGKGRGMGIPSPLWSWTNDLIAIKRKLHMPLGSFDKAMNELALEIYKQGYDVRFQTSQVIPVLVNELVVRSLYSVRRLLSYFLGHDDKDSSFTLLWQSCEPFANATVKRMLTVAHASFCAVNAGDALARGFMTGAGGFNPVTCCMRLNIVGVGRFAISLYGEVDRAKKIRSTKEEMVVLRQEKLILTDYVDGLKTLAESYDDKDLLSFIEELKESHCDIKAFEKSTALAEKRNVSEHQILRHKSDIDAYFKGDHSS